MLLEAIGMRNMGGDFNQNGEDNNMMLTDGVDDFDNVKINLGEPIGNPDML